VTWREGEALRLGPDVVQALIPHRRPLLMVDGVDAVRLGARPELWARRHISGNEEVFAGHFPGLHLWPGIYTIEGLGQSSLLLTIIMRAVAARERDGGSAAEVLDALRDLEASYQLRPAPRSPAAAALLDALGRPDPRLGISGQVDMKLLAPVFAGQELRYHVALTHAVGSLARFDVEAEAGGQVVARGRMTGAIGELGPPPGAGERLR